MTSFQSTISLYEPGGSSAYFQSVVDILNGDFSGPNSNSVNSKLKMIAALRARVSSDSQDYMQKSMNEAYRANLKKKEEGGAKIPRRQKAL